MKKLLKILAKIIISIIVIVIVLKCIFVIFINLALGGYLYSSPSKPKIKYAEFPIKVTCRVSGEEYTIEDTVICEYKGIERRGAAGKYRVWEKHLESGNGAIILLNQNSEDGSVMLYKFAGKAEYYMGESHSDWNIEQIESPDGFYINYYDKNGNCVEEGWITREEAFEKYGFELVSVEHTPPLVGNCD